MESNEKAVSTSNGRRIWAKSAEIRELAPRKLDKYIGFQVWGDGREAHTIWKARILIDGNFGSCASVASNRQKPCWPRSPPFRGVRTRRRIFRPSRPRSGKPT
jgi:hypothetical protein